MAYVRFGYGGPGDDLPIDQWMDDQGDYMARRDSLAAAGRGAWDASTRSGDNLQANRPTDVVALGGASSQPDGATDDQGNSARRSQDGLTEGGALPTEAAPSEVTTPVTGRRYVRAAPGDSISGLIGTSDPGAIGRFLKLNGMDGRGSTIFEGRVYAIPTGGSASSPDEIAAGKQLLQQDNARTEARRAQVANDRFLDRFNAGLNVWTGRDPYGHSSPASPQQSSQLSWVDRNAPLKAAAGTAALVAGLPYGFMRGGVRLGQDIGNAVDFGMRLADPHDAENHPLDEPAREVLKDAGRDVLSYAKSVAADPRIAAWDAGNLLHQANVSLNPFATPMAPTLSGELRREFGIGANYGELGFQVGTALEGGGEVAALRAAKPLSEEEKIAKLMSEGYDATTAGHLAKPYLGQGSHYVPRRTRIPALSTQPLPKWFMDSPFNVSKPAGMSRHEFYRYHYTVDPSFHGAKLPAGMKGLNGHPGWRGSDLELTKHGPPGRAWHGAPARLKRTAAAFGVAPAFATYDFSGGDDIE